MTSPGTRSSPLTPASSAGIGHTHAHTSHMYTHITHVHTHHTCTYHTHAHISHTMTCTYHILTHAHITHAHTSHTTHHTWHAHITHARTHMSHIPRAPIYHTHCWSCDLAHKHHTLPISAHCHLATLPDHVMKLYHITSRLHKTGHHREKRHEDYES